MREHTKRRFLTLRVLTRQRRQRQIGAAYAMAREIAEHVPPGSAVVDVGCGNGYIAYHLKALREATVRGVDIGPTVEAPVPYTPFNGVTLPVRRSSFDVGLLCYVLHHAGDPGALLREMARVIRPGGTVIVYEDIPASAFDQLLCLRHDLAWRRRGGAAAFNSAAGWERLFGALDLDVVRCRRHSRFRDIGYPIGRQSWVLRRREPPAQQARDDVIPLRYSVAG